MNWSRFFDGLIEYSFYTLLFIVPLILTPFNYELFEYNKMVLTYFMTTIIVGAWIGKWIVGKKVDIKRTPLDIPIILFLASQLFSTVFSIDVHTSIWGYYSRFHGGLLSTISYILLYYAFVSNIKQTKTVLNCLYALLASAFLITFYGILEHLGIDAQYWVQDVKDRVFSTLGQPNWLGAWIDGLIFIPIAFFLRKETLTFKDNQVSNQKLKLKSKQSLIFRKLKIKNLKIITNKKEKNILQFLTCQDFLLFTFYFLLFFTFYLCLLFTGSRSAYFGFLTTLISFLVLLVLTGSGTALTKFGFTLTSFLFLIFSFLQEWKKLMIFKVSSLVLGITTFGLLQISPPAGGSKSKLKTINLLLAGIIIVSLLLGTPISPTLSNFIKSKISATPATTNNLQPKTHNSSLPYAFGISESSDIRKVVWQGALDVWRHWPIFGSGVETFAYSYYNFRPRAHNDLSEWDFLYNKAHNEFLNYLATTGIVGLGTYLLMIGWFLTWSLKKISNDQFLMSNQVPSPKSQNFKKLNIRHFDISHSLEIRNLILVISIIAGYISILVTNFFGFSVVPVALLFWLFPAFVFVLTYEPAAHNSQPTTHNLQPITTPQYVFLSAVAFVVLYFLYFILRFWWADYKFASGKKYSDSGYLLQGYQLVNQAVNLNSGEPLYHSQLAETASMIAAAYWQKDSSASAQIVDQLTQQAVTQVQLTLTMNKVHVNYYKSAAKTFIYLAVIKPEFYQQAIKSLEIAGQLSPTDAKIFYNLGLLYQQLDQPELAIKYLEKTVQLKPNYTAAQLTLAKLYYDNKQVDKAIAQLKFILTNVEANQGEAVDLLKKWEKK